MKVPNPLLPLLILTLGFSACSSDTQSAEQQTTETSDSQYFAEPGEPTNVIQTEEHSVFVETVVEGLGVPWGMTFLPNGSVLVTEREGTVRIVENGVLREEPLSGAPEVLAENQGGMFDLALHPNYEENGWIYLSFSKPGTDGGSMTSIERMKLDGYELVDREEIYTGNEFTDIGRHFGGPIAFDGEGYLYFTIGDRGEKNKAQDLSLSNGNVFRFNDDGSIPDDNPFVGEDGLDEIYSYGHRNIQGMAVHPETGEIWTNEHGARGGDEINNPQPGMNYGWPEITHGVNYDGSEITPDTARAGMEQPVLHWTPSIAPSGMAFVTGERYPNWTGNILNGALRGQVIARVVIENGAAVHEERMLEEYGRIREIEMGPDGYIYFTNESEGTVNRIVPVG
jgi:glucose/arabinose dehydrogenase